MALFNFFKKRKEKERFEEKRKRKETTAKENSLKEKKDSVPKESAVKNKSGISETVFNTFKSPHITEKSNSFGKGVVVFKVKPKANKIAVKRAVEDLYGKRAKKVNIILMPSKKKFIKGKLGRKPGYKKAVVYLKKGEEIEI